MVTTSLISYLLIVVNSSHQPFLSILNNLFQQSFLLNYSAFYALNCRLSYVVSVFRRNRVIFKETKNALMNIWSFENETIFENFKINS